MESMSTFIAGHEDLSTGYEVRTNDGTVLTGIAQGIARANVPAHTPQDLMFFAGEQVVLLKRLQNGVCMGFCEGSVGRFKEQDVDFSPPQDSISCSNSNGTHSPQCVVAMPVSPSPSPSLSPTLSPLLLPLPSPLPSPSFLKTTTTTEAELKVETETELQPGKLARLQSEAARIQMKTMRPRTRSQSSCTSDEEKFAPAQSNNLQDDAVVPTLIRHVLISPLVVVDPLKSEGAEAGAGAAAERAVAEGLTPSSTGGSSGDDYSEEGTVESPAIAQGQPPRKLLSDGNLKRVAAYSTTPRKPAMSSPSVPSSMSRTSALPVRHHQSVSFRPLSSADLPAAYRQRLQQQQLLQPQNHPHLQQHTHHQQQQQQQKSHGLEHPSVSLYLKDAMKPDDSSGLLSPLTQSTSSSISDLSNCSSATMTTCMLGIKSQVFNFDIINQQDHQQLLLPATPGSLSSVGTGAMIERGEPSGMPIYQLSTPSSSNNRLSVGLDSPVTNAASPGKQTAATQDITSTQADAAAVVESDHASSQSGMPIKEEIPSPPSSQRISKLPGRLWTGNDPSLSSSSSLASPLMDTASQTAKDSQQHHHHHEHYFATVFDDLRSKTHNVLRKAGFSIAPDAGLFADRGSSKPIDLKVVRMSPISATAASSSTAASGDKETSSKSSGFFGRPRSRSVKERRPVLLEAQPPPVPTASHSTAYPSSVSNDTTVPLLPTSNGSSNGGQSSNSGTSFMPFRLDRLRYWNMSDRGGHQRSNSGPARHSELTLHQHQQQRKLSGLEDSRVMDQHVHGRVGLAEGYVNNTPLPPLPPHSASKLAVDGTSSTVIGDMRKKKKSHQRRLSEATTFTMASTYSVGAYSQQFQVHHHQQQQRQQHQVPSGMSHTSHPQPGKQHRSMSNWFGMGKRRSFHSAEDSDTKKPHMLGNGIEGGVDSRPASGVATVLDGDDYEEDMFEYSDAEEDENDSIPQQADDNGATSGRIGAGVAEGERPLGAGSVEKKPSVVVNDYGFILEDFDEETGQVRRQVPEGLTTAGSTLVAEVAAKLDSTFLVEHERKRAMKKQQEYNRMSEIKWIHAVTNLQPDQVKKSTKYKKLARRGVPPSVRGRVWQFLANTHLYRVPGLFQELLTRGHIPIHDVIARDVDRCYPDHVHFRDGMGGTGQEDLHSILKAYAHYKPSVGYCQGMGRLVGMMLMQMPIEEAFWLLVATIEGYLNEYFTPTLRQLRIDAQVFERLLRSQDARLAHHLQKNDMLPIMYMTQWFLTLFTMSLPWASVLRVWDVFYFDGVKTLFRVALAVLQICRSHLLEHCPSSSECMAYLLHVPLEILGPEVLLDKTAYRIRLRRENIEKMSALTAGEMDAKESGNGHSSGDGSSSSANSSSNSNACSSTESAEAASLQNNLKSKWKVESIAEEKEGAEEEKADSDGRDRAGMGSLSLLMPPPPPPPSLSLKETSATSPSTAATSNTVTDMVTSLSSNMASVMSTEPTTTMSTAATNFTIATPTLTPETTYASSSTINTDSSAINTPTNTQKNHINRNHNAHHNSEDNKQEKEVKSEAVAGASSAAIASSAGVAEVGGAGVTIAAKYAKIRGDDQEHSRGKIPLSDIFDKELPELPRPRSQPSISRSMANLSLSFSATPTLTLSSERTGESSARSIPSSPISGSPLLQQSQQLSLPPQSAAPSSSATSPTSGFLALSVFRTRKRAGTMHR